MPMKIYPYKMASQSAKALANALGTKRLKHEGKMIALPFINWGASSINREFNDEMVINHPNAVKRASNKLKTFLTLDNIVNIPDYTTDIVEAQEWLDDGITIVERHTLTGHSGQGIQLCSPGGMALSDKSKLYVKYIKKQDEYRLHVFDGEVFFIQRKARALDVPDDEVNWQVRNHANGFIYANQEVDVPAVAKAMAIAAVQTLDLDFGAVDMIYNARQDAFFVLEINTAPGLFGTTLDKYVEKFKELE